MGANRLLPLFCGASLAGLAARPAAAQPRPWSPAAPAVAASPSEGSAVGFQILAGVGIGAAAVGTMWLADPNSRVGEDVAWGLVALTPAAVGLAVCKLGEPSDRREPSCPRAVVAAYIGSLIAVPVLLVTVLANIDGGAGESTRAGHGEAIIWGATGAAWVGGMTAGATLFGRRRIRPPAYGPPPAPPPPWPTGFAPGDDPRQPRWAAARTTGQIVCRLLAVHF